MKRMLSISTLMLPLLALVCAQSSTAQTLVVDKPTLTLSSQVGGAAASQTINVTSSTGAAIGFTLSYPSYPWLRVNNQINGYAGTTPASLTVSADPTGMTAGTLSASILVNGGTATNNPIAVSFNVSTVGVSPQSLTFSYTVNSNNFPAPQGLTLTSAAATQCAVTSSTSSGGSWIGPLPNPSISPGSVAVQLSSAVVAGLAAGTYTGAITIAPPTGPAAVVPVTLTILPTPPVTVNPSALILNFQTGIGAANPSQTFTITTSPSQPLGYSFVQSGSLTNISTINPASGTTSATTGTASIVYTVNPSTLTVGTYTGKLTLFTFGGTPPQQDIPITLNISATALLNVPNATVNITGQVGSAAASQNVNITATNGLLNYSVTTSNYSPSGNTGWLTVPGAGNTSAALTVTVNPAGLPAGTYSANVNVTSATPGSVAQTFPVVLKVTNDPTIAVSATTLNFPFQLGQAVPAAQALKITSSTGAPLNYTASLATTACSNWLLAANANNSLTGVTDDTLTVSVATAGLVAGTCVGTVTITATNPATGLAAVNSPVTVGVNLYVSTTAQLVVTPASLQPFSASVGAQSPAAQSLTLSSTSTDVLNYSVTFQGTGGNWLFAGPQNGTTAAGANALTVSVISSGLAAGVYTGTVTVTATGPGGAAVADSPVVIPVTLNVTSGSLTLSATDISFADQILGATAAATKTVTIGSTSQALNYSAVAASNASVTWLSVSPGSGSTSTNPTLTITADPTKLGAGTYTGTITLTAPGASNSPQTIAVHLKVNPGTISAPTTTLVFTQAAGGPAPAAQSIAVTGSPTSLGFTVTAASPVSSVLWLSATPTSGTTPGTVQVSANAGTLAVGQYTGSVTITSAGASGSPITIGVILNVVTPATLTPSPTSLTFAYTIGLTAPAAQSISVTAAGGSGSVPLTSAVQFDGTFGQWLAVTPASATAPAAFSVSVAPTALVAGTYTGRIVISSSNALTSLTIPVSLTVVAIPKPVIASVTNAGSYSAGGVSPGENIVIFGSGVGPATLVQATVANNAFPTTVGNTRVLFDGTAAPVLYASNGQTSVMVPYGVAGRTTTSVVVEYSGVQSAAIIYNVVTSAPGLYTQNSQGTGPGAILNQDLSLNGPNAPEKRGNVIAIYMTGEGQTTPAGVDGAVIPAVLSALKTPNLPVTVTIGGVDAKVAYAGSAPGLISGVMQVNVTIPADAPTGTQPIVVTVGTVKSQSGGGAATVAISQ